MVSSAWSIPCRAASTRPYAGGFPDDPGILRTIAQGNRSAWAIGKLPCAGVYAEVVKPGVVRRGDTFAGFNPTGYLPVVPWTKV